LVADLWAPDVLTRGGRPRTSWPFPGESGKLGPVIRCAPFPAVLLFLGLVSCAGAGGPREVAEAYLQALAKVDFHAAAALVTDDDRAAFETLRSHYEKLGPEEQKKFQMSDWTVTRVTVTGDTATVDFTFDGEKHGQLSLRRDGSWKVDHRRTF